MLMRSKNKKKIRQEKHKHNKSKFLYGLESLSSYFTA